MNLPKPECKLGYTRQQIVEILGEDLMDFRNWMNGQTVAICDGKEYNHETKEWDVACDGVPHGVIVYKGDVMNYLDGGRVWD